MKFNEKEALLKIKEGEPLDVFKIEDYEWETQPKLWPSRLMVLAVLTYHGKEAYKEIPDTCWTQRAAKMAVSADYHAIYAIPEHLRQHCAGVFTEHYLKQSREEMPAFMRVFYDQPEIFRTACIGYNPGLSKNRDRLFEQRSHVNMNKAPFMPKKEIGNYGIDFTGDAEFSSEDEITPELFLALPVSEQTKERLFDLLESDIDFPGEFIKKISIPRRNAMYYEKAGDMKKAAYWKTKVIPYLDRELCLLIADKHPEAALSAIPYLTPDSVQRFWERKKETCSPKEMTGWFLKFPASVLNESMRTDIVISKMVLKHAPNIFLGSEEARKYLLRSPNDVLDLPEYQTPGIILLDGVKLDPKTVQKIENESFREKVKIALNIS